jgi:predicted nucleic acid-binding protein
LREYLSAFPDLPLQTEHFELAADFFNRCRRKGIQGSNTDYLLCAIAYSCNLPILTEDQDFQHFQKYLPIHLHKPRFLKNKIS